MNEIAQQASERASKLLNLRVQYREQVRGKPRATALIDELFINPYITVARAQAVLKVSNPTARAAVGLLVERRIVAPLNGNRWRRMYVSRPVLEAIEG